MNKLVERLRDYLADHSADDDTPLEAIAREAGDRTEALEKALREIEVWALSAPDQGYLSEDRALAIIRIARAALKEE